MNIDIGIIGKVLRFGATGLLGAGIDFGFTSLFKEVLKVNKFISNSVGFILSATFCFFLNKYWTYQSQTPVGWEEYLLNEKAKMHFYLSKCFAIAVASVWNFTANLLITFA